MPNRITHFEVIGKDGEALQKFYSDLFEWPLERPPETDMQYWMTSPEQLGGGVGVGVGASQDGGPGHVTGYVEVDDLQAKLDQAEQLGGRTVMPPMEMPMVTIALLQDPEGHTVGLVKPTQQSG